MRFRHRYDDDYYPEHRSHGVSPMDLLDFLRENDAWDEFKERRKEEKKKKADEKKKPDKSRGLTTLEVFLVMTLLSQPIYLIYNHFLNLLQTTLH